MGLVQKAELTCTHMATPTSKAGWGKGLAVCPRDRRMLLCLHNTALDKTDRWFAQIPFSFQFCLTLQ